MREMGKLARAARRVYGTLLSWRSGTMPVYLLGMQACVGELLTFSSDLMGTVAMIANLGRARRFCTDLETCAQARPSLADLVPLWRTLSEVNGLRPNLGHARPNIPDFHHALHDVNQLRPISSKFGHSTEFGPESTNFGTDFDHNSGRPRANV